MRDVLRGIPDASDLGEGRYFLDRAQIDAGAYVPPDRVYYLRSAPLKLIPELAADLLACSYICLNIDERLAVSHNRGV
jgi:hypothetical protein